jgi:geranylgeranyl reductase family protein
VVVGAGPAGSAAAYALARAGVRVCVIERARMPRYKTCGGGVVARAARQLSFDLGDTVEVVCHRAELNFLDANLRFWVTRDTPLVYMTMRDRLDHHLLGRAAASGAEVVAPCAVEGVMQSPEAVHLATDRGPMTARFVVACDGAASATARSLGATVKEPKVPACEWEVYVGERTLERFGSARFDFGLFPGGYAWVFPKRDHLSVGMLGVRSGPLACRRRLETYLARLGVAEVVHLERHGHVLPGRPRTALLARGRVLLAGDAAGLVDPILWEGISYAVRSGQLAAASIRDAGLDPEIAARNYRRAVQHEVLSEISLARLLSRLVYHHARASAWLFRRRGKALCEAMGGVIAGEATYRSLLGRPSHYYRLLCADRGQG